MKPSFQLMQRLALALVVAGGLAGCRHTGPETQEASVPADKAGRTVETGYGSQDPKDNTTSISSVNVDDAKKTPNRDVTQMLQGRVSGVQVFETAGGIQVRVRGVTSPTGNNEPLYVVDDVPMRPGPGGALTGINPSDIASIEVLKGAAAAIYGNRGANGVVVIKTKRGRE